MPSRIEVRRWVGEFLVIVLGVLAALGVDDFRDARSERQLTEYLLEGVRADLLQDAAFYHAGLRAAERAASAADRLLGHLEDPLWVTPPGVNGSEVRLGDALRLVANLPVLTPANATYQEMIATGSIRTLPTGALRRGIVQYYTVLVPTIQNREARRIVPTVQAYQDGLRTAGLRLTDSQQLDSMVVDRLRGNEFVFAHIRGLAAIATVPARDYRTLLAAAEALLDGIDTVR